jgi:hypothetical protein
VYIGACRYGAARFPRPLGRSQRRVHGAPADTEGSFMADRAAEIAQGLVDHMERITTLHQNAVRAARCSSKPARPPAAGRPAFLRRLPTARAPRNCASKHRHFPRSVY